MIVETILSKEIISSEIVCVTLSGTRSRIIQQNNKKVYCAKYHGLHGLFRKDIEETRIFGRHLCDRVASLMKNKGFFTTDERPEYGISYGLSALDYMCIFERTMANCTDDLVALFAYPEDEARKTKTVLDDLLRQARCLIRQNGILAYRISKPNNAFAADFETGAEQK